MNLVAKLFAIAALALSCTAQAADTAPRKEAVLDTGKGGLHVVFSTPGFTEGPIDFAGNKGPYSTDMSRTKFREVAFNAQVGETGVIVYKATLTRKLNIQKGDQMATAEFMAADILKSEGFTLDRAIKIDSPPVPITDAKIVTYKASGYSIFEKEKHDFKSVVFVTAVATNDQLQGFALLTVVLDKDVAAFDADPAKIERRALKGFTDMYNATAINRN